MLWHNIFSSGLELLIFLSLSLLKRAGITGAGPRTSVCSFRINSRASYTRAFYQLSFIPQPDQKIFLDISFDLMSLLRSRQIIRFC